eukprot:GEZU01017159.1.p1 GENE.GEZU01017159.1~~GEZU01017159.1.p1  ORF type:complete len:590 (-),score=58.08 GEZU01017159.1:84-1853(-)
MVEAVSSGAILSSYQRNRVENVCTRLGLVSLAYLWNRDQKELLAEMINANFHCILMKTAAMGLVPQKHLGKTIAELQPLLLKLDREIGVHVCGEGGEYETLTLDCPLFKKRIVIDESSIVMHSDDYYSPVGYLKITKFHLEDKNISNGGGTTTNIDAPQAVPQQSQSTGTVWSNSAASSQYEEQDATALSDVYGDSKPNISLSKTRGGYVSIVARVDNDAIGQPTTPYLETLYLMMDIKERLSAEGLTMSNVVHSLLFVSDMSQFGEMNRAYAKFFTSQPPSRVCVETVLQQGQHIQIELLASTLEKNVLHVQSISEWAPSCIGPYSQATRVSGIIRVAGQIPLKPATMKLVGTAGSEPSALLREQIAQAIQNVASTLQGYGSSIQNSIRCNVYYANTTNQLDHSEVQRILREEYDRFFSSRDEEQPKALVSIISVSGLPRAASVEYHVIAISDSEKQQSELKFRSAELKVPSNTGDDAHTKCETAYLGSKALFLRVIIPATMTPYEPEQFESLLKELSRCTFGDGFTWDDVVVLRIFACSPTAYDFTNAECAAKLQAFSSSAVLAIVPVCHLEDDASAIFEIEVYRSE